MKSNPHRSIKALYPLALAEGEGVGTAYEYYVKRLSLENRLDDVPANPRVLIAGLPEKYGASLDFVMLANDMDAREVTMTDDRPAALDKCRDGIERAREFEPAFRTKIRFQRVARMATFEEVIGTFDLCLASEVLQRLDPANRRNYVERILAISPVVAMFAPNANNPQHQTKSGLSGITMEDLKSSVGALGKIETADYIDLPPWPPGMVLSNNQRSQLARGGFRSLAMRAVQVYARLEKFLPAPWRKRHAHIIWMLARRATT